MRAAELEYDFKALVLVEEFKHAINEKNIRVMSVYAVVLLINSASVDTLAFEFTLYEYFHHITAPQSKGI